MRRSSPRTVGRLTGRTAGRAGTVGALATAALLLLGGCGSDGGQSAATRDSRSAGPSASPTGPVPTDRPTAPAAGEPTGLGAPADDTWEPWGKGRPRTDLARRVATTGTAGFTAADGDLACVAAPDGPEDATVRCDRARGLGVDQPRPPGCDGDWGDAVSAGTAEGGRLVCATDSTFDLVDRPGQVLVLEDGDAVRYRGLTCTSRADAVQCLGPSARGFVVSPAVVVVR